MALSELTLTLTLTLGMVRDCIVLDGPVSPSWAESLNASLNHAGRRALCLANGEQITLTDDITIVFEVENLDSVS